MASVLQRLTVAEFEAQYGHEKPYYEFWYGKAIQKSAATWTHGLLQQMLMRLLVQAGYKAASEVTLKIEADFHPIPDVIATRGRVEHPYPTEAVEVVIEILSEDDPMSRVLTKCRKYQQWGFREIYVVDPSARVVFRWLDHRLEEVGSVGGRPVVEVWAALDGAS